MKRHDVLLAAAVCITLAIAPSPARSEIVHKFSSTDFLRDFAAGDPRALAQVVRAAYTLVQAYTMNSGTMLSLKVQNIETLSIEQASMLEYADLGVLPQGPLLDIEKQSLTDPTLGRRTRYYHATWRVADVPESLEGYTRRPVAAVLRDLATDHPQLAGRLFAITRFTVTAEMGGQTRRYRASFVWAGDSSAEGWRNIAFVPLDPVVTVVDDVMLEEIPVGGLALPRRESPPPAKVGTACYAGLTEEVQPLQDDWDDNKHFSGSHSASYQAKFRCECSTTCTSTCSSDRESRSCVEHGYTTGGFHVLSQDEDASVGSVMAATSGQGASCARGYSCAVKHCLTPGCAFSVNVSASGTSVSFSSPGAFWTFPRKFTNQCGSCTVAPPPPPPPEDDPYEPENQDPNPGAGGGSNFRPPCGTVYVHDDEGHLLSYGVYC